MSLSFIFASLVNVQLISGSDVVSLERKSLSKSHNRQIACVNFLFTFLDLLFPFPSSAAARAADANASSAAINTLFISQCQWNGA